MSQPRRRRAFLALAAAALVVLTGQPAQAAPTAQQSATVDKGLLAQLGPGETAGFLVYLREKANLGGAASLRGDAKAEHVINQLTSTATRTQIGVRAVLDARKAEYQPFWIANVLYVRGDRALVDTLAARPEVERIDPSRTRPLIEPVQRTEGDASTQAVEWGLTNIEAPRVWNEFGVRGEGIVIANIDSGVQFDHAALVGKYRGNLGGGTFDHNYNWFDPSNICPTDAPCDNNNHGTHTMGTMVGDDGGANQIGVAPGAKWIAAKGCETNNCSDPALLASGQWVLAPTDLAGNNPRPDLRPNIVNNSWGSTPGGDLWYQATVNAWIAAGIFPMFSNGNSGPSCNTSGDPGDYPQSYSAGAYDINNVIAGFSSRGPSPVDGQVKPNIAAPGVNVRSSVPGNAYANFNGTSMASPHVAGTIALIWSAAPSLKGDINATRQILDDTATDVDATTCGGTADDNNVFGEGRLNAFQAVNAAPRGDTGRIVGLVTDSATGDPLAGATVSAGTQSATTGADGRYNVLVTAGDYTVTASKFGYVSESVPVTVPAAGSVTVDFALDPATFVTVRGTVTDGSGHGYPLYARIEVAGKPDGPVWTNPVNGRYSFQAPANTTYQFTTTVQYPGYQTVSTSVVVGAGTKVQDIAVPVATSCTAKGYSAAFGAPFLTESFDTTATPAGWSVVNRTPSGGWQFNDPGNRGNLTGGTGGFAIMDSDAKGIGNSQDSDLIMPAQDFSSVPAPYLRFNSDYRAFSNSIADVDVSTDGGTNWINVFKATTTDRRGPRVEQISLAPAAGDADALIRFRYRGTWAWWWELDNVQLLNLNCSPIPGGLVVGFTTDRNTDAPLNGVTVSSVDEPADSGVSAATPDDPNIPDGFYWLFSSLSGAHNFTATKAPYQALTKSVTVVANGTVRSDFALRAGRLTVTPTNIQSFQAYGSVKNTTVRVTNTGTAPAEVELLERSGALELLSRQGAALKEINAKEFSRGVNLNSYGGGAVDLAAAPNIDPAWTSIANYPAAIFDNAAAVLDGKVYAVGGGSGSGQENNAYRYDPATNTWAPLPDMPSNRSKPSAAVVGGKLYVLGGWGPGSVPVATVDVYDPATNAWSTVAGATNPAPRAAAGTSVVDGKVYLVGGCVDGDCNSSANTVIFNPSTGTFGAGAVYPHNVAWTSCGGVGGTVYCAGGADVSSFTDGFAYNPATNAWTALPTMPLDLWGSQYSSASGLFVLAGGVTNGFATITNRAVAYDPATNAWMNLPNTQVTRYRGAGACGVYRLGGSPGGFAGTVESERLGGLDQCDEVAEVPWLSESPETFTLAAGASRNVTVTLTAKPENGVAQPGKYTAEIGIRSNTPYAVPSVSVEMNVLPPASWGKIQGTVLGQPCSGGPVGVPAIVRVNLLNDPAGTGYTLRANPQGQYAYWVPKGRYELIVAKDGWIPEAQHVQIQAGFVLTLNFTLEPDTSCVGGLQVR